MTEAEQALWRYLRLKQLKQSKFRRQYPIGKYIVDFVCLEQRMIIEPDGGQHADHSAYDSERSLWLQSQGFHIVRFWNHELLKETEAVVETIMDAFTPHLRSSPTRGEEKRKVL